MIDPSRICLSCFAQLHEPQGVCPRCGFDNAACENAANQLECGSILAGTYLVGRSLGQGGFGITYAGFDLNLNLKVAIKEYFPSECVTRDGRTRATVMPLPGERKAFFERGKERFVSEAQTLARFSDDPAIVNVRGFFYENGTAYIVMSFVEGETLKAYAEKRGGKLPASEVLALMQPVFRSLSRVHEAELLHRDISPDNIMRRVDGSPVLIDFGAARQISAMGEHSNSVILKRGFAPVEQYHEHGEQGPWTDVYALCATIYRLTTGKTPPDAGDRLLNNTPLIPPNALGADFSPAAQAAILHGLAVRASERTKTIAQLQSELYSQTQIKYDPSIPYDSPVVPIPSPFPDDMPKRPLIYIPESWKKKIIIGVAAAAVLTIALLLILMPKGQDGSQGAATEPQDAVVTMAPDTAGSQGYAQPTLEPAVPTQEPASPTMESVQPTEIPNILPNVGDVLYGHLATGTQYSAVLNLDGTVSVYGGENSQIDASGWSGIVQIAGPGFGDFLVGLRSDGSVVVTGSDIKHMSGEYLSWQNVQAIEAGSQSVLALSKDGYVLYDGTNYQNLNACENWQNVTLLVRGDEHMVGVTADGHLLGVGMDNVGQRDVSGVSNVLNAATSCQYTYVLKRDGTVQLVGGNPEYEQGQASAANWSDIIAITSGDRHVVGLKRDGTVVAAGDNSFGQCNVGSWKNIIAICAGHSHTIALDSNGVLHMTGSNIFNQTTGDGDSIRLY